MADFEIHVTAFENQLYDNAAIVRNEKHAAAPGKDEEILRELQQVRKQLENTEPIIADAVADLEEAIQARDKPTIAKLLGKFSSEAVKGVMRTVASKALLTWMGIA
ncbi:MAG: hypothetical protein IJQ25_09550 [Oscillibacter sp.]|nr:hypothetical protein [Oscillibacter sp.]